MFVIGAHGQQLIQNRSTEEGFSETVKKIIA